LTKEQKIQLRREREIKHWEKEKNRPKGKYYIAYVIFIITLIYAVDEIASQITTLMKTEIANDLFATENSIGLLNILTILVVPFQALGLLYRPLADRFGRKVFLIFNTFGMSLALLIIFLSQNVIVYFIGACMVQFFIPHDMHVVYIMESSSPKQRARTYSVIKFVANMGVMLIPLMRKLMMENASEWRNVFLVPAIVGLVASFIALLLARETDSFIDSRLRYLRLTDEERQAEKERKALDNAQGGLIPALKFALKHKQLRWLYITSALMNIGFIATIDYQAIMTYGYATNYLNGGLFQTLTEAVNSVSTGVITDALFLFPIGSAVAQVIMGFVSDIKGRKLAAIVTALNCLVSFILFFVGANLGWSPYFVGLMCGACIGSYYSSNDVIIMMIGESSPTNLRSSTMSAQFIVTGIGVVISYGISLPLTAILGNTVVGIVAFCLLVPGFISGFISLVKKCHETKGIDMERVKGDEWD
ncbi:MAG: MFS transporter, partial [Clostridia bacterium]|nr:MFS transporter [Clostridia bacterium]